MYNVKHFPFPLFYGPYIPLILYCLNFDKCKEFKYFNTDGKSKLSITENKTYFKKEVKIES